MTDKQIKEGIDVSQCECYSVEDNSCNKTLSGSCMKEKCQTFRLLQAIQAKEQECEGLEYDYQNQLKNTNKWIAECENLQQQLDKLKKENEKMSKGYAELTEIVSSYIDDFTGYNEELGGFDIVLCVKELLQQLNQLKVELEQEKALKETYLTCYKAKHEDIEGALFKLKQTIAEIKEITKNMNKECFYNDFSCGGCDMINGCTYQGKLSILQKISECEVENAR